MKFWDTSAIIPLLLQEDSTETSFNILQQDPNILVWTLTSIECLSAIYRKDRETPFTNEKIQEFKTRLSQFEKMWSEVNLNDLVKKRAEKILAVHPLRSADALQLAAAIIGFDGQHEGAGFVTYDKVLARAALKEGFEIVSE